MKAPWYGADPSWWVPMERDARRLYRDRLSIDIAERQLTYSIADLATIGDDAPYSVRIVFSADPTYTYGLPAPEFPRVYARRAQSFDQAPPVVPTTWWQPGEWRSPHRHPDGALCIWYPRDPPERRWLPEHGLLVLIELAAHHLIAERYHWAHGSWPLDEAAHGLSKVA